MNSVSEHKLYRREILQLATSLPHNDVLNETHQSATCRAPVCGSEMTAEVAMNGDSVSAVALRAKACALGQASAAVLRTLAIGQTEEGVKHVEKQVKMALKGQSSMPEPYASFAYATDFPARHGAILLPFETLLSAMAKARS